MVNEEKLREFLMKNACKLEGAKNDMKNAKYIIAFEKITGVCDSIVHLANLIEKEKDNENNKTQ